MKIKNRFILKSLMLITFFLAAMLLGKLEAHSESSTHQYNKCQPISGTCAACMDSCIVSACAIWNGCMVLGQECHKPCLTCKENCWNSCIQTSGCPDEAYCCEN